MQEQDKIMQQLKDAFVAIKKLKADLQHERYKQKEPIAIVGMAMRFPGAVSSSNDFWNMLQEGKDVISDIPEDRFDVEALYDKNPEAKGKIKVKQGGFLQDIDKFDASFYDITPIELESMDPQQRLLLEVTHEALENAGTDIKALKNTATSVYCGVTNVDYQKKHFRSGDYSLINNYAYTGSAVCAHAGRISYLLGLQGPSMSLDTACSSSLVATHLAVQSLRNGESSRAIVGACNIILEPELTIFFSGLNGLSIDSRCKPFANEANGFIRSEACAVIVLKRLSDAQKDGDNILALIKGSAVNQDGHSNGFTAPDVNAQTRLLQAALLDAGVNPEQVNFIEAHGTGTKIGDPIEMEAIANVFASSKSKDNPLLVGSVKSNMGHTECVAGLAGIIKTVLAIQNKTIPKNIHFNTPNELIDWKQLPIEVPISNKSWVEDTRIAGVSGFGVTGTNAHVLLCNYLDNETEHVELRKDIFLLPISAKTSDALKSNAKTMATFLKESNLSLEEICANSALNRTGWAHRKTFCAITKEDLINQLESFEPTDSDISIYEDGQQIKNVFVFPGQGTQWQGMALQLAQNEIVFKTTLDECAEAFSKVVTWDLWEVLKKGLYEEIDIIQPALVAVQIALAKLWQNYGINPDIVVGHSMGEVSAAYIAGNITLDEAAEIICNRSLLMKTKSGQGEMLATDLTFEEATVITDKTFNEVSIAVVNSPNSIVLSGNPDKLKQILTQLEEEGRFAKRIMVDVASHSAQMDSILPSLAQKLDAISPKNSEVQFYSTALNKIVEGESLDAQYWTKNLRNPVQFGAVITSILKKESVAFFEMSPHPTLIHAIQENISLANENAKVFASLYREKNEQNSFFSNIGELYASGYLFDWKNIYKKWNKYIQLPNYAWQKQRFWFDEKPKNLLNKEDSNQNYIYTTSWQKINFELFYQDKSIGVYPLCNSKIPHDFENLEVVDLQNIGAKKLDTLVIYVNSLEKVTDSFIEYKSIFEKVLATKQQLEIIVVTHNAIVFEEEKTLNTVATILWGATRSLINEHPELDIKLIDTDSIISVSELIKAINLNKETVVRKEEFYSPVLIKQISFKKSLKHTEGVCLITGGTSGLGLETALWLANFGFKKIALVSRTGAKKETSQICDILMNRGVEIKIYSCDITSAPDLKNLINTISVELGDISTLIHAAGNLEDAPFINLDKNKIDNVLNPKLALPLIIENIGNTLKAVYLYSSAASILGTNAQSNYTAANFFLDQYAKILRNSSIEAISINWGNIGEIGMAAADDRRGKQLSELGIKVFDKQKFHSLLDTLWGLKVSQLMAIDIDFEKWSTSYPMLKHNSFFSNFIQQEIAHKPKNMDSHTNINSAIKFIKQTIVDHIATITKLPKANIKEDITFKSLGIDSMMAVQLKNKMQESFEMQIAVATIWSYPTVEKFSAFVVEELQLEDKFNLTTKAETSNNSTQNVDDMSLEDLMRELDEKSN